MSRSSSPPDPFPVPTDPSADDRPPSKTRRKAEMHALQDLGEALMALDPGRLAELDLPERLVDALREARSTRSHEGARRQRQYVGKLMREVDAEPLRAALERISQGKQSDQAEVTVAETWRESLLRDDAAMAQLIIEFPDADRVAIAKLMRDARQELARNGPPHRYRELFRHLKALAMKRAAASAAATAAGTVAAASEELP